MGGGKWGEGMEEEGGDGSGGRDGIGGRMEVGEGWK